ncbi:MAG: homoserine O-acetyltransferase [Brevinematales bacterium]
MNDNSVGIVDVKCFNLSDTGESFIELDSGKRFGPISVAYETYGSLNDDKSNAILVCHALSGSAHAAGFHKSMGHNPGWWENFVGPGKALDTDKYFIICSNILGGCMGTTGPSSIDPGTGNPYGISFPVVTIGDMVKVQKRLIDHLGIKRLLNVIGGSMGGMQALEWILRYPEVPVSCVIIAATSRSSAQSIAFNAVGRKAILSDRRWKDGSYYGGDLPSDGVAIARMIGHITYLSEESMRMKFGRRLQDKEEFSYDFSNEFQVESYLDHQGNKFVERFDANSYLYVTKAMDYFDAGEIYGGGLLEKAFENIRARSLILSFTSDWLFPPQQSKEIVDALMKTGKDITYINIKSSYGHDAFLIEMDTQAEIISKYLMATYDKKSNRQDK